LECLVCFVLALGDLAQNLILFGEQLLDSVEGVVHHERENDHTTATTKTPMKIRTAKIGFTSFIKVF
jgi:hypothetical protein